MLPIQRLALENINGFICFSDSNLYFLLVRFQVQLNKLNPQTTFVYYVVYLFPYVVKPTEEI